MARSTLPLGPTWTKRWDGEEREEGRKKKKEKEEKKKEFWRERHHLLSRFPNDRTGNFRRSKRKSSSSLQGLRIETGVVEFRKTPRGRGVLVILV